LTTQWPDARGWCMLVRRYSSHFSFQWTALVHPFTLKKGPLSSISVSLAKSLLTHPLRCHIWYCNCACSCYVDLKRVEEMKISCPWTICVRYPPLFRLGWALFHV
jgi:hypothetical protein